MTLFFRVSLIFGDFSFNSILYVFGSNSYPFPGIDSFIKYVPNCIFFIDVTFFSLIISVFISFIFLSYNLYSVLFNSASPLDCVEFVSLSIFVICISVSYTLIFIFMF